MISSRPVTTRRRRVHMVITPLLAQVWLDSANLKNRPLSENWYLQMACDMLDGRWLDNGDAIRFGSDGVLLDGQHRLRAVVECGIPLETDVIFGLDPQVLDSIDIGKVRTSADVVHMGGVLNSTNACALAAMLLNHRQRGVDRYKDVGGPTKSQIINLVKADPKVSLIAGRVGQLGSKLTMPRVVTFCYYVFAEQDHAKTERFFSEFASGDGLERDSPVFLLRERMIANKGSKAKLPLTEVIALFFKAWIAYRDGNKIRCLRWQGKQGESFPDIRLVRREVASL
jgi:hypothetical protein